MPIGPYVTRITAAQIDDTGHLNHVESARLFESARIEYGRNTPADVSVLLSKGLGYALRDVFFRYHLPGFEGDEITISSQFSMDERHRNTVVIGEQEMHRGDDLLVATRISMLLVDIETQRPTKIPPELIEALGL